MRSAKARKYRPKSRIPPSGLTLTLPIAHVTLLAFMSIHLQTQCCPAPDHRCNVWETYKWHIIAAACFYAAYVFVYGYHILRLGLLPDEMLSFRGNDTSVYTGAGRWANAVYRQIMHEGTVPFAAGMVSGLYLSICYVIQATLLKLKNMATYLVFGAAYLGMIQFAAVLECSHNVDAISFGFLLCTIAAVLLFKPDRITPKAVVASILLVAFAVSIYQTIILYFCVLALATYLARLETGGPHCIKRDAVKLAIVVLAALGLFYLSNRFVLAMGLADQATVEGQRAHQAFMMGPWYSFHQFSPAEKLFFIGHAVKITLLGALGVMRSGGWITCTCIIPLVVLFLRYKRDSSTKGEFAVRYLLVILIWLVPHLYLMFFAHFRGANVGLADPLSCACLWALTIKPLTITPRRMAWIGIAAAFVLSKACYHVSYRAFMARLNYDTTTAELREIYTDALRYASRQGLHIKDYEIILVHAVQDLGETRPDWQFNHYNPLHWRGRFYGMHRLRGPLENELTPELMQQLHAVDPWPAPNCFILSKRRLYVKVTHYKPDVYPASYSVFSYEELSSPDGKTVEPQGQR